MSQIPFFKQYIGFWKNFTENFTESLIISQKSCFWTSLKIGVIVGDFVLSYKLTNVSREITDCTLKEKSKIKFFYFIVNFIIQFFLTVFFGTTVSNVNVKHKKQSFYLTGIRLFFLAAIVLLFIFFNYYWISRHQT